MFTRRQKLSNTFTFTPPSTPQRIRAAWPTLAVIVGVLALVVVLTRGVQLATSQPEPAPSAPVAIATVMPLAVQYAKPVASTGRTTIVRTTINAHPPITPGRPLIIMPNAPDYATRRAFSERCAACHQPY